MVWGGLRGGLLLASVATIHKGLTHGVSYRVVGVTFLQLTTTALLVRRLVLGGYSDALGFLVEKYF